MIYKIFVGYSLSFKDVKTLFPYSFFFNYFSLFAFCLLQGLHLQLLCLRFSVRLRGTITSYYCSSVDIHANFHGHRVVFRLGSQIVFKLVGIVLFCFVLFSFLQKFDLYSASLNNVQASYKNPMVTLFFFHILPISPSFRPNVCPTKCVLLYKTILILNFKYSQKVSRILGFI